MNVIENIKKSISEGDDSIDTARKVFLSYQTKAFEDKEDVEFAIKDAIKNNLRVPFVSIQVAGSAKTGFSFFKQTLFTEGKSDLDISIINLGLFNHFLEVAHRRTDGFTDLTHFPDYKGRKTDKQFLSAVMKGFLNPFFMPDCTERTQWLDFFRDLSNRYYKFFKNINAGIYSSEYFFEYKQMECINEFKGKVRAYDSLPSKI